jgi:magnesium and cobalt transporter
MSDPSAVSPVKPSVLERISALILRTPVDRRQLLSLLRQAGERQLIDADALSMIEGVLQVSELAARDIMVPRSKMDVIDIRDAPEVFVPRVIATAHSRFPVIDGDRDKVIGILHAKELLRLYAGEKTDVRDLLRPAVFIPESKRLDALLRDFRADRHHLAIVVDEYGGTAGLITIEDVLEQIVGDIEDEFDYDEASDHVLKVEAGPAGPRYRVRAMTALDTFNEATGASLVSPGFDTIGGLVTEQFGRVPRRGESVELDRFRFEVLRADARQIHLLLVETLARRVGDGDDASA